MVKYLFSFLFFVPFAQSLHASLDDASKQISSAPQQAYDGGSSFIKGVAQSFGYCPDDYVYNFEVWNDTPQSLFVAAQKIINVQGASFDSEVDSTSEVKPYSTTGNSFYNKNICHLSVWLCKNQDQCKVGYKGKVSVSQADLTNNTFFYKKIDVTEKDPTIYYFHMYSEQGIPQGEFLGPGLLAGPITTSNEFDGIFYNKTTSSAQLRFIKDNTPYTVTLEPQSWSLLSSTSTIVNSIRPKDQDKRTLDFILSTNSTVSIPLASKGLAYSYDNKQTEQKSIIPATYTYALYEDAAKKQGVDIQGISMGNADQPGVIFKEAKIALFGTKSSYNYPSINRVRDINPVTCLLWYQSAQQATTELAHADTSTASTMIPYNSWEQCWLSYVTKDATIQQKITPGTVATISLLRPQLAEQTGTLYVVAFATTDSNKITQFLKRLAGGLIGKEATYSTIDSSMPLTESHQLLSQNLHGLITDTQDKEASGISGIILLADTFTSRGMGEGPFYYKIPPSLLQLDDTFFTLITSLLDTTVFNTPDQHTSIINHLKTAMAEWVALAAQKQSVINSIGITKKNYKQPSIFGKIEDIVPDLVSYLKQHGDKRIFINPQAVGDARTFNEQGKQVLYTLLFGPLSITNPPLLRQAGTNYSVVGGKPAAWPKA